MRNGCVVLMGLVVAVAAGCGGQGAHPLANRCTAESADPNACLALAKDRLARKDDAGVREYMEKLVVATNAAPACLRDHDEPGCFAGVVALLREHPVGLLAAYDLSDDLLASVPRWTGSDATGPRMQARLVLVGMCTTPGRDAIAQQRACIVLGDLVSDERMRRCGPGCDPTDKERLSGWSTADVIDGYAAACRVDRSRVPAVDYAPFAELVAKTYAVASENPVCAVATSTLHGASIPEALASADRIRADIKARESSAQSAQKREAERLAAMEKSKAEAAVRVAAAEEAEFRKNILDAIHRSDWPATFGQLTRRRGSAVDATVADALQKIWEPFTEWAIGQTGAPGAYLDLSSRLELAPKNHAIRVSLASFRERALAEAKKTAKSARGVGGAWLHAAVVARIAGPLFQEEQRAADAAWAKLVASTRTSLVLEALAPACASLVRPPVGGGRTVKAKAALECIVEPEQTVTKKEPFKVKQRVVGASGEEDVESETVVDVVHRTYKVSVQGVIAIYAGAPRKAVPIAFAELVDDVDGSDARKFDNALKTARELIAQATVGALEAGDAAKAYAAGATALKNGRKEAAENHFVIHGVLAGSSPELDEIMMSYGVTFADLMPAAK